MKPRNIFFAVVTSALILAASAAQGAPLNQDALKQAKASCEQGMANACFALGTHMLQTKELTQAISAFTKSCELGFSASCRKAVTLQMEQGQLAEALKLAQASCATLDDQGESCFWLAQLAKQRGINAQAKLWYERSCRLGHSQACNKVEPTQNKGQNQ